MNFRSASAALLAGAALTGCASVEDALFDAAVAVERQRAGLDARRITVDGREYAYLERAGDGDTLVLLHGFASQKDVWIRFVRHLPDDYRVIVPDLPGHGDSARDPGAVHDAPFLAAGVGRVLDALGVERYHLAGNSLGGMVAVLLAHRRGAQVRTLVLIDAAGVQPPRQSEFERLIAAGDNPLIVDSRAELARMVELVFVEPPPMPWPAARVLTRRFAARKPFTEKLWRDIWGRRELVTPLLPGIAAPTLVVWGEQDRILDVSSVAVFEAGLPDAEVVRLARTGHSPMLERPRDTARLVADFLLTRSGRGSGGSAGG